MVPERFEEVSSGLSVVLRGHERSPSFNEFGPKLARVEVPVGASIFPKEISRPSRRWAEPRFPDLRHWNELDKGGHFAAFEQPEVFVGEVRTFFRTVR